MNILVTQFLINFSSYRRQLSESPYSGEEHSLEGMVIFFTPWVVCILAGFYWTLTWYEMNPRYFFRYFIPLKEEYKTILSEKFRFYNRLSSSQKKAFEKRVNHFLINKKIESEIEENTTDEMKVLIAASCIQLTFGLKPNYLSYFNNIKVLHENVDWRSVIKSRNQIIIPWHEFMQGYNAPDDGYNPGLEIMATAISMEQQFGKKSGYVFGPTTYRVWREKSKKHAEALIRLGVTKYNSYSDVNKDEYFAITVVSFFEQPENFKARFPDLYDCMVRLLKQNPLKYKK